MASLFPDIVPMGGQEVAIGELARMLAAGSRAGRDFSDLQVDPETGVPFTVDAEGRRTPVSGFPDPGGGHSLGDTSWLMSFPEIAAFVRANPFLSQVPGATFRFSPFAGLPAGEGFQFDTGEPTTVISDAEARSLGLGRGFGLPRSVAAGGPDAIRAFAAGSRPDIAEAKPHGGGFLGAFGALPLFGQVAGALALALGQPEIGLPLLVGSGAVGGAESFARGNPLAGALQLAGAATAPLGGPLEVGKALLGGTELVPPFGAGVGAAPSAEFPFAAEGMPFPGGDVSTRAISGAVPTQAAIEAQLGERLAGGGEAPGAVAPPGQSVASLPPAPSPAQPPTSTGAPAPPRELPVDLDVGATGGFAQLPNFPTPTFPTGGGGPGVPPPGGAPFPLPAPTPTPDIGVPPFQPPVAAPRPDVGFPKDVPLSPGELGRQPPTPSPFTPSTPSEPTFRPSPEFLKQLTEPGGPLPTQKVEEPGTGLSPFDLLKTAGSASQALLSLVNLAKAFAGGGVGGAAAGASTAAGVTQNPFGAPAGGGVLPTALLGSAGPNIQGIVVPEHLRHIYEGILASLGDGQMGPGMFR